MNKRTNGATSTKTLVMYALLTAVVVILQIIAEFVKVGPCALSLVLIPIVVGGALCGWKCGAWLGFVFAVVTFACPSTLTFFGWNMPGTIITVISKSVFAGIAASVIYNAIAPKNKTLAVFVAAIVAPIVNTGIFLLGCKLFFYEGITKDWSNGQNAIVFVITAFVLFNFLFELITNILLSPAAVRIIKIRNK